MDLTSWLTRLRHDLGDPFKRRWKDDAILLDYLNEGLCELYAARPELFSQTCKHKLMPGGEQCIDDCCKVLCVVGIYDADGVRVASVTEDKEGDPELDYPLKKPSCLTGDLLKCVTRTVHRYSGAESCFGIQPPIDKCDDLYVKVEQACQPKPLTMDLEGDIDGLIGCSKRGPVLHYALAMARRSPGASAGERSMAAEDMQLFGGQVRARADAQDRREEDCDGE